MSGQEETATETISEITTSDGGKWMPVLGIYSYLPSEEILEEVRKQAVDGKQVVIKMDKFVHYMFHSFRTSKGREWDCINGWREKR